MDQRPPGEPQRKPIEGKVRRFIFEREVLSSSGRLLLAVSGGPDSSALLLIMARLAKNLRLGLGVAYFDHGLRDKATNLHEEAFVRDLAGSHGLPFFSGSGDVRGLARLQRLSLEDAARRARYEFLAGVAEKEGFGAVATGHTASDQAETVLLNLIRGAGLEGLSGMEPRAPWPLPGPVLSLVRPLLCLSGQQTRAYCAAAGVSPQEDESNASRRFRRNRVRHELLPLLREMNPEIDAALVRLADSTATDAAYLNEVASQALTGRAGSGRLSLSMLRGWPASPRRHALMLGYASVAGDARDLAQSHLRALERLVLQGKTGDRLDLPRGVTAVLRREALQFRSDAAPAGLPEEQAALAVPGETRWGPLLVAATQERPSAGESVEVDAAAVGDGLCVRRRRPGDRFQPLGMSQSKKLQDFLTDAHVPRDQRDSVPLFVSPRGIVWVGGLRVAEWAVARSGAPSVFLSFRPA